MSPRNPRRPIHVRAGKGAVAPVVLLMGDPARTRLAAERLEKAALYNDYRGLLGFTGLYRGIPVSVQTTGIGGPSAAIVAEEMAQSGARVLIRLGTCGAARPEVRPGELVIATASCPVDGTTRAYTNGEPYAPAATYRVVRALVEAAEELGTQHHVGLIATEDAFYAEDKVYVARWAARGVLALEMEASALFTVAALRGLEAGCALTVSNVAGSKQGMLPDKELAEAVEKMLSVGLEAALRLTAEV
jgi:purine-nucleoside phosphorylase